MLLPHLTPPPSILPLASERANLPLAGGKGANLARLAQAGLPVPGGFTITTQAYHAFAAANGLTERIPAVLSTGSLATPDACEDASARIRDLFRQGRVPADLAEQILDAYAGLGRPAVAVRSSATAEDLPEMSFAGQQDTYLNVIGADAAAGGGRRVLEQPVDGARHQLSRAQRGGARRRRAGGGGATDGRERGLRRPVHGQPADGVARGDRHRRDRWGWARRWCPARSSRITIVVEISTGQIISRTLGAKALSVRSRPGGGTMTTPEDTATAPALSDPQILALAALGQQVSALYDDTPQDIEWALANDTLYLLQARPITSLFPVPAGLSADPLRAMLSFGAVQGMLDPITPLGRSLIEHLVAAGAQLFSMTVKAETQNALFTAGERLWINLTPAAAQHGRPPDHTGDYELGRPGRRRGAGCRLARSTAATHPARGQPRGSPAHRARRGAPRRPCAAQPALPRPAPALHRGTRGAPAPRRGRALRRDPGRAARPAGPVGRALRPRSWPSTCRPPSASSSPAWPAAWPPSTWSGR